MEEERNGGGKSRIYIPNLDRNIGKAAANLPTRRTHVLIERLFRNRRRDLRRGRRAMYHGP
jgi:hypothetical protein